MESGFLYHAIGLSVTEGMSVNIEAAQRVYDMFDLSGVFSDKLKIEIYNNLVAGLDYVAAGKSISEDNEKNGAYKHYTKIVDLLNTYCIFSRDFRMYVGSLVHKAFFRKMDTE
jgi:hypothetical protein